jgi:hypothetical protein
MLVADRCDITLAVASTVAATAFDGLRSDVSRSLHAKHTPREVAYTDARVVELEGQVNTSSVKTKGDVG